jgi:hypothetical protein
MYASLQLRHVPYAWMFRWCARAGGAIVVIAWLALVILEMARPDVGMPAIAAYYQAAALALVFVGYALGWRKELVGGLLAMIGTGAFFAVHLLTIGERPWFGAIWFAAPGVLYVLAWIYDQQHQDVIAHQ